MDAKPASLVARRGHHPALARATDGHRFAAQFRIVALLDRRVECIHVDMDNLSQALGGAATLCKGLLACHVQFAMLLP